MAVKVWIEAGSFAVERRQACMDATGQGGVGRLTREGLDPNLQRYTVRHIGDRENML